MLAAAALALGVLAGCSSSPVSLPRGQPFAFSQTAHPAERSSPPMLSLQTPGLNGSGVRRLVEVTELRDVSGESADSLRRPGAEAPSSSADARLVALRVTLERALRESGHFAVRSRTDRGRAGNGRKTSPEMIVMSGELDERPERTIVRLRISDPRSAAPMEFVGIGEPIRRKTRLFASGDSAVDTAQARMAALDFAVGKALKAASAVLGMLPWQATLIATEDDRTVLIAGGARLGLMPGVLLSIQTRETVLPVQEGRTKEVIVPSRIVGEVLIIDNVDDPERGSVSVGSLVKGGLRGYPVRDLVVRFCRPTGYFGHDFGHDRECTGKAAALVHFDPATTLLSFAPPGLTEAEGETARRPYTLPPEAPSPVF